MIFRFTLSHSSGTQIISEPIGWKESQIILDRDQEFSSLIEHYETKLSFFGSSGEHDGGKDFIETVLRQYGFGETIRLIIEVSDNEGPFEVLFEGILNLETYEKVDDRTIECGILQESMWTRFINRITTPVDIQSEEDLDGNEVEPAESVKISLKPQRVKQEFIGTYDDGYFVSDPGDNYLNYYFAWDTANTVIGEVHQKYNFFPPLGNTEVPGWIFEPEYEGNYNFDIRIELSYAFLFLSAVGDMKDDGDYRVRWYFKKNNDPEVEFTIGDHGSSTSYTFNDTIALQVGDRIRVYGFFSIEMPGLATMLIWGKNNDGITTSGGTTEFFLGPAPSGDPNPSRFNITGHTIFPESESEGFLIHDLFDGINRRISGFPVYSEMLGSTETKARQYDANGCESNHVLLRGLQVRGYTLDEKRFFQSFKEAWDGANPIFNLGLDYDNVDNEQVIRIEGKAFFYVETPSVLLSWVNGIKETIDKNLIFKKISLGYNKWQAEDISSIDDPQTKRVYSTFFENIGTELNLLSGWIAASLAIEVTRRKTIAKTTDYKFDNDTFLIAVNPAPEGSPETFLPELDENFESVSNLLNAETRYNLFLTPMRNLFRWANYITGCLQSYLSTQIKFRSGEGNYDFTSEYDCASGLKSDCQGTVCGNLSESDHIPLSVYAGEIGYLHSPILYEFQHPLSWADYKVIRNNRRRAIGVSTTDQNHEICFIKRLEYDINKSKAKFIVWKK